MVLKFINLFFFKKKSQGKLILFLKNQFTYDRFVNVFYKFNLQGVNLEIDLFSEVSEKKIVVYTKDKTFKWVHNKKNHDRLIANKIKDDLFQKNRETEFKVELRNT